MIRLVAGNFLIHDFFKRFGLLNPIVKILMFEHLLIGEHSLFIPDCNIKSDTIYTSFPVLSAVMLEHTGVNIPPTNQLISLITKTKGTENRNALFI